ncbi:unnamed protein product [marine sediment metagenome]|uniref:Uncharacterized protein n=1 Tax=marine sediment metagenome TaxID=412755 RepID=X1U6J9_9ZZZZ
MEKVRSITKGLVEHQSNCSTSQIAYGFHILDDSQEIFGEYLLLSLYTHLCTFFVII